MVAYNCPVRGCIRTRRGDQLVCGACEADLARALADIPWLAAHLEVTRTRQSRIGGGSGAQGSERPTPWDERAASAAVRLGAAVRWWASAVWKAGHRPYGPACLECEHESCAHFRRWQLPEETTIAALARWLLGLHTWLLRRPSAAAMCADIGDRVADAELAIDRPPEAWYAGPCAGCGVDMYADPTAVEVHCRTHGCDQTYGVRSRREWLIKAARDTLGTATLIAQALTAMDRPLTPERIWQWKTRGRIIARANDQRGRPLYRVGDITDVQDELDAKREAAAIEREARNGKIAS